MSKQAEVIRLCEELLRDFENPFSSIELLVNKAHHISGLADRESYAYFLYCESSGYPNPSGQLHDEFLKWTSRLNEASGRHTLLPAAILEQNIKDAEDEMSKLEVRDAFASPAQKLENRLKRDNLLSSRNRNRHILHQVRRLIYQFASILRSELLFSQQSADIFSRYQAQVDGKIARAAEDAFSKLPAVSERLAAGDAEAISHALTSCRRIIEAFADAVFPPRNEPVMIGEQSIDCGSGKTKNQLRVYISQSTPSESRRDRLRKNMIELWDRISAGVHDDVTPSEARALVLNTYLLLGELVELKD